MGFYDESQKAVQSGVSWAKIREATSDIQHQLRSMKFEVASFYYLILFLEKWMLIRICRSLTMAKRPS